MFKVQIVFLFFYFFFLIAIAIGIEAAHDRSIYDLVLSISVQQLRELHWWFTFSILPRIDDMLSACWFQLIHNAQSTVQGERSMWTYLIRWMIEKCALFVWKCRNAVAAFRRIISHIRCDPACSESRCHASTLAATNSNSFTNTETKMWNVQHRFAACGTTKQNDSSRECDTGIFVFFFFFSFFFDGVSHSTFGTLNGSIRDARTGSPDNNFGRLTSILCKRFSTHLCTHHRKRFAFVAASVADSWEMVINW